MPSTAIVYVGPFRCFDGDPPVEAPAVFLSTGQAAQFGVPLDVESALAGRPPSGEPGTEGYDPGEGLLAQSTCWQPAAPAAKTVKEK